MFDYEKHFNQYRANNKLDLELSFNMPEGYKTANGTFDIESKTVFINAELLKEMPDYEKAFYLFHELRHSSQYLCQKGRFLCRFLVASEMRLLYTTDKENKEVSDHEKFQAGQHRRGHRPAAVFHYLPFRRKQ